MTRDDLHPVIARMVTAQPIPPGTAIDRTPFPSLPVIEPRRAFRPSPTHCACGVELVRTGKRGRPATRCDACRVSSRAAA